MKLCVFQGTFNPIHNVHLALANFVKEHLDFDTILFIPAYKPPHKEFDDDLANHRYEMVRIAIDGEPAFNITNIEYQNSRFSYTYLTLIELAKRYKIEGRISFIIGSDAFFDLEGWYEADKLKAIVEFLVFPREPEIDKKRYINMKNRGYIFKLLNKEFTDVASSTIRERIGQGKSVERQVPPRVLEYIKKHDLYKEQ